MNITNDIEQCGRTLKGKISGLDASEIPVGAMAGAYQINIEWNTENLIIGTSDGIKTYRFDD